MLKFDDMTASKNILNVNSCQQYLPSNFRTLVDSARDTRLPTRHDNIFPSTVFGAQENMVVNQQNIHCPGFSDK